LIHEVFYNMTVGQVGQPIKLEKVRGHHSIISCKYIEDDGVRALLISRPAARALARAYLLTAAVRARGPSGIVMRAKKGTRGRVLKIVGERGKGTQGLARAPGPGAIGGEGTLGLSIPLPPRGTLPPPGWPTFDAAPPLPPRGTLPPP
jgi:hypothetical protein